MFKQIKCDANIDLRTKLYLIHLDFFIYIYLIERYKMHLISSVKMNNFPR